MQMRVLVLAAVFCLCLATVSVFAAEWTGYVSDAHCGAMHMDGTQKSIDCVKTCVKGGQAPVFVTMDKKVLQFADAAKAQDFLGKKVTVMGTLKGDTITLDSVKAAK
jgi:hypothetical protein